MENIHIDIDADWPNGTIAHGILDYAGVKTSPTPFASVAAACPANGNTGVVISIECPWLPPRNRRLIVRRVTVRPKGPAAVACPGVIFPNHQSVTAAIGDTAEFLGGGCIVTGTTNPMENSAIAKAPRAGGSHLGIVSPATAIRSARNGSVRAGGII